jgi:hypothetical protein
MRPVLEIVLAYLGCFIPMFIKPTDDATELGRDLDHLDIMSCFAS